MATVEKGETVESRELLGAWYMLELFMAVESREPGLIPPAPTDRPRIRKYWKSKGVRRMNVAKTEPTPRMNRACCEAVEVAKYIDAKPRGRQRLYHFLS